MKRPRTGRVDRGRFSSLSNGIMRLHRSRERRGQRMRRHDDVISPSVEQELGERRAVVRQTMQKEGANRNASHRSGSVG